MIPKEIRRQMKTMKKVRKDQQKDSTNPTSRFSQMIFVGASAVSTAVNLNLFLNKYFQLKK